MKAPQIIDQMLLDRISAQASAAPRKRKNYNFHTAESDLSHRLLNAIEPGTYVPPHRHLDSNKDETMILVRGRMGVVFFDEAGTILSGQLLCAGSMQFGAHIPHGCFHSIVALEAGTVFFETKAGPYQPLESAERASWAPQEGEAGAMEYLARLKRLFD